MSALRLGTLAYAITAPASFAAWQEKLESLLQQGAAHADLLLLPEYAAMELAASVPGGGDAAAELARVAAMSGRVLEAYRAAAMRHGVWLAAGSLPWVEAARVRNRAPLISPQGHVAFQDKCRMTRFEAEDWGVEAGEPVAVFETPWGRIGIAICYDCEFPEIVRAQAEAGAWLILVPSCTDTRHGDFRIRIAARARALECQVFVAVAATVGEAPALAALDRNCGRAAVYGPVDRGFAEDGVVVQGEVDAAGWVFATLDPARIETVRGEGAVRNWRDRLPGPPSCRVEAGLMGVS